MPSQTPPVVSVIGRSKSGKTTLLEGVIRELKRRGYRVGTIKHHSHAGFEIDQPGKDSWRHARAGSDHVMIAAPDKLASIRLLERELPLYQVARLMPDVDIILTEGYKAAGKPMIEVARAARSRELLAETDDLIAVASDFRGDWDLPHFSLDDAPGIVSFLERHFLSAGETRS
jgi:molybdopterin-guanine dinucleotide biosynthesis protein B